MKEEEQEEEERLAGRRLSDWVVCFFLQHAVKCCVKLSGAFHTRATENHVLHVRKRIKIVCKNASDVWMQPCLCVSCSIHHGLQAPEELTPQLNQYAAESCCCAT